ncbi:hypothetical protein [Winogradskyella alexanderae]|uniref:Poly(Hydroxyalkanoate) granule-associated protein n=1 Tax=Winogradskyella alexanderae TaxID=2877123 RepID=A0ABS7XU31_9FLAO|nr:hypothetical protein [Winogradskyella alexanderae]MCA0133533.1 hypothetical protein [Winogradskyella alexanderae]
MEKKAGQTASFMIRFNQIFYEEKGESKVQWRGRVSHVQGGKDQSFSDFSDAVKFIQEQLAELTLEATKHKSQEQQESLFTKSLSLWKTVTTEGPKVIMETIKDPRKQVAHLQDQISEFGEDLLEKVPIDDWRNVSRTDFKTIKDSIAELLTEVKKLNTKVDAINKTTKTSRTSKPKTTTATKKK